MIERKKTKKIRVGNTFIGGGAPISVQTMTTADPHDFEAVLTQARVLQTAGADLIRLTVPDEESAAAFSVLKREGITVPLVADIHFDHKSAIASAMCGADKIRINPGNIGDEWKVKEVASTCKILGLPIRIGVNSGSLERPLLEKYGAPNSFTDFSASANPSGTFKVFRSKHSLIFGAPLPEYMVAIMPHSAKRRSTDSRFANGEFQTSM